VDFSLDAEWEKVERDLPPSLARTEDPVSPLFDGVPGAELVGQSASDAFGGTGPAPDAPTVAIDDLDLLASPAPDRPPIGMLSGLVPELDRSSLTAETAYVIAVNDEVVGVSPVALDTGLAGTFAIILPGDFMGVPLEVRIARLDADGTVYELGVTRG